MGRVVGEEGFLNITLYKNKEGARFYDLQRRIKELKSTGIVLAVVSKNNEHDAKEPFEKHPYMLLKLSDFVAFKANWKPKSENIRELARELNIGLDSFVLLDDNPVEQEEVKASIPEVEVLEFPRDTTLLQETINRAFKEHFHTLGLTKEDTDKTLMYLQERERKESIKKFISADDYLNSLDMKVKVHLINESDIERVAQLTQKTNQFNLTTRRYTAEEIRDLCYSGSSIIYVISVSDRFGDSGTVSVLIFNRKDDTAHIDTFLMSCRVMGRYIEDDTFPAVLKHLLGLGVRYITAEYIPSSRNEPVKTLFERLGFDLVSESEDGRKEYRLSMENSLKSGPGYSQVILI
jgi:FkbH-like protein